MNAVLVATAVAVVAGAVVAVSAREARLALLGLAVSLLIAPLVADPLPDPLPIAARLLGGLLAIELLWVTVRTTTSRLRGSLIGWPTKAVAAAAAALAGYAIAGGVAGPNATGLGDLGSLAIGGTPEARAAGFALIALAAGPVLIAQDVFRTGVGAFVLLLGAELVRVGVVGPASGLEQLVISGITATLGVAVAAACANAYAANGEFAWGRWRAAHGESPSAGRATQATRTPADADAIAILPAPRLDLRARPKAATAASRVASPTPTAHLPQPAESTQPAQSAHLPQPPTDVVTKGVTSRVASSAPPPPAEMQSRAARERAAKPTAVPAPRSTGASRSGGVTARTAASREQASADQMTLDAVSDAGDGDGGSSDAGGNAVRQLPDAVENTPDGTNEEPRPESATISPVDRTLGSWTDPGPTSRTIEPRSRSSRKRPNA